jgi:hypothetical protein
MDGNNGMVKISSYAGFLKVECPLSDNVSGGRHLEGACRKNMG